MKTTSKEKSTRYSVESEMFEPKLNFDGVSPVAAKGLAGLVRDHFGHGRLCATVGYNGCLVNVSYAGNQHLGGFSLFNAGLETGWYKVFRVYINIGGKNYYPRLHDTQLHPFGYESHDKLPGVAINHDLLLLPDALVQRVRVASNPKKLPIRMGMLHQEGVAAVGQSNREWSDMVFEPKHNAFIWSCTDVNPPPVNRPDGEESLAQRGRGPEHHDAPRAVTWIGLGSDFKIKTHCGYHARSKHYIETSPTSKGQGAFYLVFATSRPALEKRLKQLSKSVHQECDKLVGDYQARLAIRPKIDVGNPILNSAFNQYPEVIEKMKLPDRPGASRATLAGYFVWGWDGMMPLLSSPWANEPGHSANNLRFFQETRDARLGLPHSFSTDFKLKLKGPFPSQAQYIAGLYFYLAATGDLSVAREVFPTCKYILEQSRKDIVKDSGLVLGPALWPDFPEAMEENGDDISSMNNSMLYQGLRSMEYIALKLGHAKLAADYREWAVKLRKSFVKYLYDEKHGFFISSCSSIDFKPRKHYCAQAIFWLTPFARELVSHAPGRISSFLDKHLRSAKCLLTLPHWDTAWMADGNQLGSSYPAADSFYLGVHKVIGDDFGIKAWLGDVEWFWRHHTAPEAFTPEAENEDSFGPDNWGGKQAQAVTTWYAGLFTGLAGLDIDHEGLTLTPWGKIPVDIRGLKLRGVSVDIKIRGEGTHIGSLKLNGKSLPGGLRKIAWKNINGKKATIDLVRSKTPPSVPVIVRADGLSVKVVSSQPGQISAQVASEMSGEIAVQAKAGAKIRVDGKETKIPYERSTGTFSIPFPTPGEMKLEVTQ